MNFKSETKNNEEGQEEIVCEIMIDNIELIEDPFTSK